MRFSLPKWLVRVNRVPVAHEVLSFVLPPVIRRRAGSVLKSGDLEGALGKFFFRGAMGNVDTNKDGVEDAFRFVFTNFWFDQRILGFLVRVDDVLVPDEKLYFRSAGRLYPVGKIANMDFAPGREVECMLVERTLSEGLHFLEIYVQLEYARSALPPLPIVVRDEKADFAFLGEYNPLRLPERPLNIHFIPHVHYDAEWLQPREVFEPLGARNLYEMLRIMEEDGRYTFVIDQCAFLEPFKREHPAAFERIRRLAAEGRIEHACGMYAEPDTNIPCGESLARQAIAWQRFAEENFGGPSACGWLIDSFGQSAQLPQILSLARVKAHVFSRQGREGMPSEFWWEGLDGTRVLAHWMPLGYSAAYPLLEDQEKAEARVEDAAARLAERAASGEIFCPSGCDHARPQAHAPRFVEEWNEKRGEAPIYFSLPSKFFEKLPKDGLQTLRGDFEGVFSGTHSSRIDLKILNRRAETRLLEAERLAAICSRLEGSQPPDFSALWEPVMLNQFHDVICGCCTDNVARGAEERVKAATKNAETEIERSIRKIVDSVDTEGFFNPLLIVNLLPYEREEVVEAELFFPPGFRDFVIADGEDEIPRQVMRREDYADGTVKQARVIFGAKAPALGYRLLDVRKGAPDEYETGMRRGEWSIGNELVEYHFHPEGMYINRAVDRRSGKEFVFLDAGELLMQREGGDLYESVGVGQVLRSRNLRFEMARTEAGPLRARVVVRGKMRDTEIEQEWTLNAGSPRLDLKMRINFGDERYRLRMRFPMMWKDAVFTHGVPFGAMARGGGEWAAVNWADVSGGGCGYSVFNEGIPAHAVEGGDVVVTLLRGADGIFFHPAGRGGLCLGRHEMRLALCLHEGGWREAGVPARAQEFLFPLRAVQVRRAEGGNAAGKFPASYSLLSLEPRNLILSAICPSAEKDAMLVRIFESQGEKVECKMKFCENINGCAKVDFLEQEMKDGKIEAAGSELSAGIKPFEVATFRLR
ncbi:MAG: glycoside hydrolase family 38 C-terminal domain-containing protein [bacterium]